MKQNDPMQGAKRPKRMRQPEGRMSPVASGQVPGKPDARAASAKTAERPLHDYMAEVSERTEVRIGVPLPLVTYEYGGGVNFAFFSRHATRVCLELFDHPEDPTPARMIDLDPARHRTGDVWHVWVEGIRPGQLYAYRVDGTDDVDFALPPAPNGKRWHLAVDTSREAPQDLFAAGEEPLWEDPQTYHLSPRSSAILLARGTN